MWNIIKYIYLVIMKKKIKELIEFVKENIDMDDVKHTYEKMCLNKTALHYQNYSLYYNIITLIAEFCTDNDMCDDFFDVEEIFYKLMD